MSTMTYKGYAARIEYRDEDGCFIGHIAGIKDVIGFHAESTKELRAAFEDAVNDYLKTCDKLGRAPQKPYSGKLMLRVPPRSSCPCHNDGRSSWDESQPMGRGCSFKSFLIRHNDAMHRIGHKAGLPVNSSLGSKLSMFDQQFLVKGGTSMKSIGIFSLVFIVITSTVFTSHSAGPSEERIRNAYKLILTEADTNKDGTLSVSECKSGYKDPVMAEKNCKFWDADNDGIITEDEYVRQGMSFGKKK